jgi:MFS family permease
LADTVNMSSAGASAIATPAPIRLVQLLIGIVCMVMIANLQYGWTLFVTPIDQKYHWGRAAIQLAFTIFVLTETWLVPVEGWLVDRFGPKIVVLVGGILVRSIRSPQSSGYSISRQRSARSVLPETRGPRHREP